LKPGTRGAAIDWAAARVFPYRTTGVGGGSEGEVENPTEISYSGAKRRGGDGEVRARRQTDETKIETNGGGGV